MHNFSFYIDGHQDMILNAYTVKLAVGAVVAHFVLFPDQNGQKLVLSATTSHTSATITLLF